MLFAQMPLELGRRGDDTGEGGLLPLDDPQLTAEPAGFSGGC